jgi:hypothetical protein
MVVLLQPRAASSQDGPRVTPGFGVDTTAAAWSETSWHAAVPEIYGTWADHLRLDRASQSPTPRWSSSEQEAWPTYDFTTVVGAGEGTNATVLDIRPTDSSGTDATEERAYVVTTLFSRVTPAGDVRPLGLIRVYAVREDGRWVLRNALSMHSSDWVRAEVGPITYVTPPDRPLDRERALSAVAFADSVATRFGVPRLDSLTYYVAPSPEELHRFMGVDWAFGQLGHGYAMPLNRVLLSGDSAFGEENRHELVHVLLASLLAERRTHSMVNEGVATWLGGSVGLTFPEVMRAYARYLRLNPDVSVDAVLEGGTPDRGWSPTGAVLALMVHERGGWSAARELLTSGRDVDDLRAALVRLLDAPWEDVVTRARERVLAFGP